MNSAIEAIFIDGSLRKQKRTIKYIIIAYKISPTINGMKVNFRESSPTIIMKQTITMYFTFGFIDFKEAKKAFDLKALEIYILSKTDFSATKKIKISKSNKITKANILKIKPDFL